MRRIFWSVGLVNALFMAWSAWAAPAANAVLLGQWGGDRALLTFTAEGTQLDLECATGTIQGPVQLASDGRFDTVGTFEQLRGGPQREDAKPDPAKARYVGRLEAGTLTLQVWPAGEAPLVFRLRKGVQVKMVRCY